MSRWVPRVYHTLDYAFSEVFEPEFNQKYNGLMLRSGEQVNHVYLASFPTSEILGRILGEGKGDSLLYIHHPIHLDAGGEGFLPISPRHLQALKGQGTSVYACHAPMDCHTEVGTNASIVQALELTDVALFDEYGIGYAGRIGNIAPTHYSDFVTQVKEIFQIDDPKLGGKTPDKVSRIAVVAGGADDIDIMKEAESLGAEVYLTGEWYSRLNSTNPENMKWSDDNRKECQEYAENSSMAFIGVSHAASEYHVMKTQMKHYFQEHGLTVRCMEQSNWWR
jgi:putative NIF3 family GTP cyclohydrolase 1 type 2